MAKKQKKVAKTKKVGKTKMSSVEPTFMAGDKPLRIALHDVIRALRELEDEGHMSAFVRAAKKQGAMMLVEPATVNFVKSFMAMKKMQNRAVARHIINPRSPDTSLATVASAAAGPAKDPFECDLSKH